MSSSAEARRAAFIDRDGVINDERHYVHRIEDFVLLPNVAPGLRLLSELGYELVVVTNQAGIARGLYDEATMHRLHAYMEEVLGEQGVHLRAIYYCPHHPDSAIPALSKECNCRKPRPGMLLQAAKDLGIDLSGSLLIGDKRSDVEAGRAAGLRHLLLVRSGHPLQKGDEAAAHAVCEDLLEAARWAAAHQDS